MANEKTLEIRVYDRNMMRKGVIENERSLLWVRKYFEPGTFEMHAPLTDQNLQLLVEDNLIAYEGSVEAGTIEEVRYTENFDLNEIVVKGRFLSSYLDRRLIRSTVNFSGKVEVAMRQLVSGVTAIPLLELGDLKGYTSTVRFQATMKNLLDYEKKLASSSNLGFRCRPDFSAKKIYFEVYQGTDRTTGQNVASRVTFSEEYENLNSADYIYNSQIYKTLAVVGGQGEGSDRVYVEVGGGSGLDLREVFVDAKDIRQDKLTDAEYKEALRQRGLETLAKDALSVSLTSETRPDVNFTYKKDYDLGDIVTVQKTSWGLKSYQRITEIQEVYENKRMKVVPTFGSPLPEAVKWED